MSFWGPLEVAKPLADFVLGDSQCQPYRVGHCICCEQRREMLVRHQNYFAVRSREALQRRMATLAPEVMRAELASLGERIEAARK